MNYFFGSSPPQPKRRLVCRVGASIETLEVVSTDKEVPQLINNKFVTAQVVVRVKNSSNLPYFYNKKRLFSLQLALRFKQEFTADDVVFGAEFDKKGSLL